MTPLEAWQARRAQLEMLLGQVTTLQRRPRARDLRVLLQTCTYLKQRCSLLETLPADDEYTARFLIQNLPDQIAHLEIEVRCLQVECQEQRRKSMMGRVLVWGPLVPLVLLLTMLVFSGSLRNPNQLLGEAFCVLGALTCWCVALRSATPSPRTILEQQQRVKNGGDVVMRHMVDIHTRWRCSKESEGHAW